MRESGPFYSELIRQSTPSGIGSTAYLRSEFTGCETDTLVNQFGLKSLFYGMKKVGAKNNISFFGEFLLMHFLTFSFSLKCILSSNVLIRQKHELIPPSFRLSFCPSLLPFIHLSICPDPLKQLSNIEI